MEEQKLLKKKHRFLKEGNRTLLASVCNNLAALYLREGKYERSIEEFTNEAKIHKEMGQRIPYARANRMIGEVYSTISEFEKALTYQNIHLTVAREENDKLEQQRALATIGRTHLTCAINNPDNLNMVSLNLAHKAFMKSLMLCESLKDVNKCELMDMRARLLLNIGVVQENRGKFDSAIEYMMQAMKICKTNDIFDQLHQVYMSLGLLYYKKNDYSKAINHLNLAFEVASRLEDKVPPMVQTLNAKAEVLFKLPDFQSAKHVLLKAFKLKTPNKEDHEMIQRHLKVVAALCYTEESLVTIADSDFKLKKKLYEKMGDGACELKIFDKAIDYYKKMLEYAELSGECGKDLIPVYVSLAQTYKDNKQYDLAIEFFQKEYEVSCVNPKDSYSTLLSIAEVYELSEKSYEEIVKVYEKARSEGHATGEIKIEGKVIRKYINFLKQSNKLSEASVLEKELCMMDYVTSDSEEEEESESGTPNIGDDIAISDISDNSEDSDNEEVDNKRKPRKRGHGLTMKRNAKGETPLHRACIKGNLTLVRRLLDQGHVVNIRDYCGWLPIHEACLCGHKDIVELLIEKGANINDRGGTECGGMTPLHDACGNAHLEVIEYLLDHGASALAQTDKGETCIDLLKACRKTLKLNPIEQTYYETVLNRLAIILKKAGRLPDVNSIREHETPTKYNEMSSSVVKNKKSPNLISPINKTKYTTSLDRNESRKSPRKPIGSLRYTIDNGSDEEMPTCSRNSSKERLKSRTMINTSTRLSLDSNESKNSPCKTGLRYTIEDENSDNDIPCSRNSSKERLSNTNISIHSNESRNSSREKSIGSLRYMINNESDDDTPTCSRNSSKERLKNRAAEVTSSLAILENNLNDFESAENEYKRVMQNLRTRPTEILNKSTLDTTKRSAILSEDEVGEDWLDDDMGINQPTKKRKFGTLIKQNTRKSDSPNKIPLRLATFIDTNDENEQIPIEIDDTSNDSSSNIFSRKRKNQLSLLETGFSRRCVSPERTSISSVSINRISKRQPKISNFTVPSDVLEPDSTTNLLDLSYLTSVSTLPTINRAMYAISVRIENKLWRIPIPASDVSELTIGWLANEAAKRYYSKEGILPTLQLETKEGAILVNEDPLSIVFLSAAQPEEVQSSVLSWNLPPLPERYIEASNNLKIDIDTKLRESLDETQGTMNLNLANFPLKKTQIIPLFRALNRENNLQYIDLSGSCILNEGLQQLCTSLTSLNQLRSLNLSLNNLTDEGIRYFSNIFINCEKPILENLCDLNLSYNLIGDDSLRHLALVLSHVKLRKLILIGCNFTDDAFDTYSNVNLRFDYLDTLDLSYNKLNRDGVCKFISFLDFKLITHLNLSNNLVTESGILKDISFKLQHCNVNNMKTLDLARCKVNDAEIWDFLRLLSPENQLEMLNLSYNEDLTSVSLRRLIQHKQPPHNLNLEGCDNIFQYCTDSINSIWTFDKSCPVSSLRSIKISLNYEEKSKEAELLASIWEQEWGRKAKINKLFNSFMHLSVCN